jgi:hypothetical protein
MSRSRRVRTALVAALALAAVVVAAVFALRPPPHEACRNFPFTPPEWRAADAGRRATLARLIVRCHTLSHRTLAGVRRVLGPPRFASANGASWPAGSGEFLQVTAGRDGHVTGVRLVAFGAGQAGLPLTA